MRRAKVVGYFALGPSVSLCAFASDDRFARTIFTQRRNNKPKALRKSIQA
jgi:hypothetical protein